MRSVLDNRFAMKSLTIENAIIRAPFLAFAQSHAEIGGTTPGCIGLPHDAVDVLEDAGLLAVRRREAEAVSITNRINGWSIYRRRYWVFTRGPRLRQFRDLFHAELRGRNLPHIMDIDDGYGRAAFRDAWHKDGRASDIRAAALAAWRKLESADAG